MIADGDQLVADLADRLIPGHARPLPVDHFHRIFEPALAAYQFAHRSALGAMRPAIDRAVPGRLLADPHVVRHFCHDRAADGAMGADAFAHGDLGAGWRRRAGFGLAHRAERERAERCESAGKARAAQESAAVEAAFVGRVRHKRAATRLTLGSSDQHGRLPISDSD